MSFASVRNQQFGVSSIYTFSGNENQANDLNVLAETLPEGKYIYQVFILVSTNDILETTTCRIRDDSLIDTNVWEYDVNAKSHYVNMTGIWDATGSNTLNIRLYNSTETINSTWLYSGTLTCLKIV